MCYFWVSAPGMCISGDTLIDTAFRDKSIYPDGIPVKDLVGKKDIKVYSYDTEAQKLVIGNVKKIWRTGIKQTYKVSYFWWGAPPDGKGGRQKYFGSIKVTDNHPFLLKSGMYRSLKQGLKNGDRLQPFYRHGIERHSVGVYSGTMKTEAVVLGEHKLGRKLEPGEQIHHRDRNPTNDTWKNLELMDIAEHARLHATEDNVMFNPKHRAKYKEVINSPAHRLKMSSILKKALKDPIIYAARIAQIQRDKHKIAASVKLKFATDPVYYHKYLKGRTFRNGKGYTETQIMTKMKQRFPNEPYPPSDKNHTVYKIEKDAITAVYDLEVEKYHNFAANGIFVHNSEDVLGKPFVGPAGKLLDLIVSKTIGKLTWPVTETPVTWVMTNLVSCIPRNEETGAKFNEPSEDSISACSSKLAEVIKMCRPKLLVNVGKLAATWSEHGVRMSGWKPLSTVNIDHPAFILRSNEAARGLLVQRAEVKIFQAICEVLEGDTKLPY